MPTTKKDDSKDDSKSTEGQATDAQGNVLKPGSVVPFPQNQELADKGIYQPVDQAANGPGADAQLPVSDEDKKTHEDHRKNMAKLPPVPSERAGAASQAK